MKKDELFYVKSFKEASFFYIWCSLWKPSLMNKFIENLAFYENDFNKKKERIDNKECYIKDIKIPIASFSEKEYKWLKWHCPLDFVREHLKNDLGIKDYWFYKIVYNKYE